MSVRHIGGRDDRYIITTDYAKDGSGRYYAKDGSGRFYRRWSIHLDDLKVEASLSPLIWHRRSGHGIGFQFGRNGSESDIGLDLHVGRLGSVWMRLRSPWTKWANITDRERDGWYEPRLTGIRLFPYDGCFLRWEIDHTAHSSRRSDAWWREQSITANTFFGLNASEKVEGDPVPVSVPMPEGSYPAVAKKATYTTRYTGRLGRVRDLVFGPRSHSSWRLDIPGGIPVEGKGENSWDCGMDGIFGTGGKSPEDAIGNAVRSVLRDRKRYGGPHNLTHPTTVTEAGLA